MKFRHPTKIAGLIFSRDEREVLTIEYIQMVEIIISGYIPNSLKIA